MFSLFLLCTMFLVLSESPAASSLAVKKPLALPPLPADGSTVSDHATGARCLCYFLLPAQSTLLSVGKKRALERSLSLSLMLK